MISVRSRAGGVQIGVNSGLTPDQSIHVMDAYSKDQKSAIEALIHGGGWADLKKWPRSRVLASDAESFIVARIRS